MAAVVADDGVERALACTIRRAQRHERLGEAEPDARDRQPVHARGPRSEWRPDARGTELETRPEAPRELGDVAGCDQLVELGPRRRVRIGLPPGPDLLGQGDREPLAQSRSSMNAPLIALPRCGHRQPANHKARTVTT
jgi:hypothetical protein